MVVEKYNFNYYYIYTLFLNWYSSILVKIQRELSEICGAEMLFIDMFGHDVQQPWPWRDVTSTNHDVCLFATSPDNAFYAAKSLHRQMKTVARLKFI